MFRIFCTTCLSALVLSQGFSSALQNELTDEKIVVVKENQKAFIANDLDRYVVYDLMSDGSMVFKDTLNFNEYRDKALFTLTQNQNILNKQVWANTILLLLVLIILVFIVRKR